MRNSITILVTILFTLLLRQAYSQTPISGVVNTYYKVTGVDKLNNNVTVVNASGLAALDKVMLIQMKGASINTTNSSSFGTITNLNFAGNYELATVCRVEGNIVYFINTITSNYEVADKVQLVEIPKYASATVVAPLEAKPWDNTLGIGGVLAISVSGTLTLNANISADGKGFSGGQFALSNESFWCTIGQDYVYDPSSKSPQWGAYKGESVADIPVNISGGRAAAANGGGGGNNHNNGGGGGSNLSAGGNGGGNFSTTGCRGNYPGEGGKALQNNANTKIYLGGGGGAGHGNNTVTVQTGGGNGGGIILIEAANIICGGYSITANGQNGSNSTGDGASAGGAGGTIIINASFSGPTSISAKGGQGGRVDNEGFSNRCYGDGGGGSGGAVYFAGSAPAGVDVSGGQKGSYSNINSPACPIDGGNSTNGEIGKIIPNYSITQSTFISSSCPEAKTLPVNLVSFTAQLQKNKVTLAWQVTNAQDAEQYIIQRKGTGEEWKDITTVKAAAQTSKYQTIDAAIWEGAYLYQLKIIEKSGAIVLSPVRYIIYSAAADRLMIYPNPVKGAQEIILQNNFKAGDVVKVFDATGKLVVQKRIIKDEMLIKINLSSLQKGIYMIQTSNTTGRLMIQ